MQVDLTGMLILECEGNTYGCRFNNDGDIEHYRLNENGEWEILENDDTISQG